MGAALLLVEQIAVMFLYMAAGWVLFRTGKISTRGTADLAGLLVWLVIPVVIVRSFCVAVTPERVVALGLSAGAGAVALAVSMALSRACFRRDGIDAFAAAFSNAGFIGIPLVSAALGAEAVFFIATFIAALNILQWTVGVAWIRSQRVRLDCGALLHPIVLGTALGLLLFLTGAGGHLPEVVDTALAGLAGLNAPLAMFVLGAYLAQTKLVTLAGDVRAWRVSAVRLVVVPLATITLFWLLPLPNELAQALVIAASAPVGANVAVYAQLYDCDYIHASRTVVHSTLLSLVTMPLMLALFSL